MTSPLINYNRFERTFVDADQTTATQFAVDVRQLVRFELYERFEPARLTRRAHAARSALLGIDLRNAIIVSDHCKTTLSSRQAAKNAKDLFEEFAGIARGSLFTQR